MLRLRTYDTEVIRCGRVCRVSSHLPVVSVASFVVSVVVLFYLCVYVKRQTIILWLARLFTICTFPCFCVTFKWGSVALVFLVCSVTPASERPPPFLLARQCKFVFVLTYNTYYYFHGLDLCFVKLKYMPIHHNQVGKKGYVVLFPQFNVANMIGKCCLIYNLIMVS